MLGVAGVHMPSICIMKQVKVMSNCRLLWAFLSTIMLDFNRHCVQRGRNLGTIILDLFTHYVQRGRPTPFWKSTDICSDGAWLV